MWIQLTCICLVLSWKNEDTAALRYSATWQQQPEAHGWSLSPFQTIIKSGARPVPMEAPTAGSAPSLMSDNASGGAADSLLFIILEVCSLFLHAQERFELCIFPCVTELVFES